MKYFILLLFSFFIISCGNNKQETAAALKPKPLMSVVKEHQSATKVRPIFLKEVENWQELKAIDSFFVKFEKISPNEALSNALELKDLVKSLKDSVIPVLFDVPAFKARVNILENESLRLADLTLIPAIKASEVNAQVDKTILAFSGVNTKINTILAKKRFEDEIDVKVDFIGLDTTKMDDISKKSIDLRLEEKLRKKDELDDGLKKTGQ
ncbi:hypothetical protein [Polaribacter aestuariivivens]|uniref:hypothetical protein n=1 Tax=Polaribacter aestuariivivens TaxID=2304626 RepID=UPI003F4933AC